jgi:ornithine cyclodeaminase/alanine dehydrogenase-like protein (mu-crystallin family)
MPVLVLSHGEVHAALSPGECETAMTAALAAHARGQAYMPLRSVMAPPGAPGILGLMPAYAAGAPGSFALKAVCIMPSNPSRGLDAHQGTVTLFDGETGIPTAILNGSALTEIRTAAVTAAATRALARPDSRVLAIIGAGVQARAHLRALAGVREWAQVRVFAPTAAHVRALTAGPAEMKLVASASARDAVSGADVVVTVTSAREPVIEHGWLEPGAHLNAVGASTPSRREIDVATVAAAALFCDSRESLRHEAGEFRLAVEQGAITGDDHVRAELGEVLAGLAPGRADAGELTLFRSLGLAVEDLAAAQLAVATARGLGLGTDVEL